MLRRIPRSAAASRILHEARLAVSKTRCVAAPAHRPFSYTPPGGTPNNPHNLKPGLGFTEMIKFGIFCIPAAFYLAYVLRFGPTDEDIEQRVLDHRSSDPERAELHKFQKNVLAQAVYAPEKLDSTVTELLQGGRYQKDIKDKRGLYDADNEALQTRARKESEANNEGDQETETKQRKRKMSPPKAE